MILNILTMTCVIASTHLAKAAPEDDLSGNESSRMIPLMKHGTKLDMLSVLQHNTDQMLGIIGGLPTNITAHPYQVAIDDGKTFVCAGALLNRIWAVTLASCTDGAKASSLTVRIGSNSNLHGGTVLNVTEIAVHPNYNYTTMDYDFALLKLNTYICFDQTVQSVDFATVKPPSFSQATISGWGSTKSSLGSSEEGKFYQLTMRILAHSICQRKYSVSHDIVTSRMFCATAATKGPCYNDFGDPLIVNNTLYGLFSWSRGCANPNYPAVFNNLASVKDWIFTTMNNACTCGFY